MGKPVLDGELMFPSQFLCAEDLKGRDVTVTIENVSGDDLMCQGGKKKHAFLLSFVGKNKKLVMNKTNATAIAKMLGTEARKWQGQSITLYPTTCKFGKDTVTCIRIRETADAKHE